MKSLGELNTKFHSDLEKAEAQLERLKKLFREEKDKLPEDLCNPQDSSDSTEVNFFANTIYDIGSELLTLGDVMGVGESVKQCWEGKEENCYADIEEKRHDHGVYQRDFA